MISVEQKNIWSQPILMKSINKKKIGDLSTYPTKVNIHIPRGKFSERFLWKIEKKRAKFASPIRSRTLTFTMLFFKCVKIRGTSLEVQRILNGSTQELPHTQLKSLRNGTWHFEFFGNHDSYYWWDTETKKAPLRSKPFSAHLYSLYNELRNSGMPEKLIDCLLAAYLDKSQKLSPHRDLFGKRYFNQHEHVFLTFAGLPRDLVFNPHRYQRRDTKKFLLAIRCSSEISIELMPLANVLFVHSKTPSNQDGASLTYTFRRGVPYTQLRQFYPSIYHNARRQRFWQIIELHQYHDFLIHPQTRISYRPQ